MLESWQSVAFTADLQEAGFNQLNFLEEVNRYPSLRQGPVVLQAINRYERFWLPLAAKHPWEQLAAPLDIEWVWHCHMLAPLKYQKDSSAIAGCIVDHKIMDKNERKLALIKSKGYWEKMYPSAPFEVELGDVKIDPKLQEQPLSSYDIAAAVSRQAVFYYQVSLPHFRDGKYLQMSLERYKKFIYLKQFHAEQFLVPCYDIDLIWHSHQLHPLAYKRDTEYLLGRTFNHDDDVVDRSVGSKLYTSDMETRKLWKAKYNEGFAMFGAMYRGDPPNGKLYTMTEMDVYSACTKSALLSLDSVRVIGLQPSVKRFKLRIFAAANNKENKTLITLKGPQSEWRASNLVHQRVDTKETNCLKFHLVSKSGFGCMAGHTSLGENTFNLLLTIEQCRHSPTHVNETIDLGSNQKVIFTGTVEQPIRGPCWLFLSPGTYDSCIMPETVEQMWGPIPLPQLQPGVDNKCEVASHRLANHTGQTVFTVRVIHSLPLLLSAIHVFHHDKMAVVAHLVGSDQIPLSPQVAFPEACITMNPRAGERAVLIKNNLGDWAVVKGRWAGLRKGDADLRVRGSPGYLFIQVFKMETGRWENVEMTGYLRQDFKITFQSLILDLQRGYLRIDEDTNEIPENVALAFSISLLHVLCQPRPKDWQPGEPVLKQTLMRGKRAVQFIPSHDMAFIMAAGFITMTPSNYYIYDTYGDNACAGCGGGGTGDIDGVDTGVITDPCGAGIGGRVGDVTTVGNCGDGGDGGDGGGCGGCGGCGGGGCGGGGGGCGASCGGGGGGGGGCVASCGGGGGGGCGASCGGGGGGGCGGGGCGGGGCGGGGGGGCGGGGCGGA